MSATLLMQQPRAAALVSRNALYGLLLHITEAPDDSFRAAGNAVLPHDPYSNQQTSQSDLLMHLLLDQENLGLGTAGGI